MKFMQPYKTRIEIDNRPNSKVFNRDTTISKIDTNRNFQEIKWNRDEDIIRYKILF